MKLSHWVKKSGLKTSYIEDKLHVPRGTLTKFIHGCTVPTKEFFFRVDDFTDGEVSMEELQEEFLYSCEVRLEATCRQAVEMRKLRKGV
jgi:hypothetical protein